MNHIIKTFIFFCLKIALFFIIFIGTIYLFYSFYTWYTHDRHANKIKVTAEIGNEKCNPQHPLFVSIVNYSSKNVAHSAIYVKVSYIGHSNYLNDSYHSYNDDRIIISNKEITSCWRVESKESYSYSNPIYLNGTGKTVKVDSARFKFID